MYFEYINPCFTQQSGFTKDDLLNKHVNETIYKGKIPESRLHIAEALQKGETWQGGLLTTHKTGSTYWASTIASPYKNEKNEVEGFIIIQQDITAHKQLQIALDESERLYRTLIEKSLDGAVISQNGKVILVNKAFCDMIGCTEEEALNSGPNELLAPEDRERVVQIHYQRMRGEIDNLCYTASLLHKSGRRIAVEFHSTTVQVNGANASFINMRDITNKSEMEKALRESEKKYRTLINKATDGILITQDGVFKFVNPAFCEMMQYTEIELINKPFIDVVDKKHHAEMLENHKRRMTGESFPAIYRAKLYRKDGSSIMVELNSRTTDFDGSPASFVITRDITDRLQTEEELRKAQKQLENLNKNLEIRVHESTLKLTEANTQLIRLQKENLQSQFEVLRQQVNPHFLFNSLNVLTSLIKLEPDLA